MKTYVRQIDLIALPGWIAMNIFPGQDISAVNQCLKYQGIRYTTWRVIDEHKSGGKKVCAEKNRFRSAIITNYC